MKTLGMLGEREIIRRLAVLCGPGRDVRAGIGDDAAVVGGGGGCDWVFTTDPVIEGSHFLPEAPGWAVGGKAAGRVLSDLAAMGAEPCWLLADVEAPASLAVDRLEDVYRGMNDMAARHGAAVIGGDLARGERLALHLFAVGRLPSGTAVLRSGGQEGDLVYVTGSLGGSLAGRHLAFEPRVREGVWLRENGWATAMIDVSDGLAGDLGLIAAGSGWEAVLEADRIPVSAACAAGDAGLRQALYDGEDFELLFTVPPGKTAAFEAAWLTTFDLPCTRIGRLRRGARGAVTLLAADGTTTALRPVAFDHFDESAP